MVTLHHIFGHGWHQGARQDEPGQHRDDNRLRHGSEQVAGYVAELEERQPDDCDAQGGDERRHNDLIGRVDDGLFQN